MNMYLLRLLEYMKPQETVLQALKRTEKKTQQPQKAHKKPKFAFMEGTHSSLYTLIVNRGTGGGHL